MVAHSPHGDDRLGFDWLTVYFLKNIGGTGNTGSAFFTNHWRSTIGFCAQEQKLTCFSTLTTLNRLSRSWLPTSGTVNTSPGLSSDCTFPSLLSVCLVFFLWRINSFLWVSFFSVTDQLIAVSLLFFSVTDQFITVSLFAFLYLVRCVDLFSDTVSYG